MSSDATMSSELTEERFNEEYPEEWWLAEGYASEHEVPVPDWHWAILEERMARYKSEPVEWIPWEEVKKELMQKIADAMERQKK